MASRRATPQPDADGVRVLEDGAVRRVVRLFLLAAGLVAAVTAAGVLLVRQAPEANSRTARAPAVSPPAPAPTAPSAAAPRPEAERPARPPRARRRTAPAPAAPAQPSIDARDYIAALRAAGERGGIAAFPPPGSVPLVPGIVVPEGFELPEGYVRHHQTTDDGRQLPAILMFHPDYEFVDERGEPVALPEGRVVPPEMAPPGLPIEMLELPEAPGAEP